MSLPMYDGNTKIKEVLLEIRTLLEKEARQDVQIPSLTTLLNTSLKDRDKIEMEMIGNTLETTNATTRRHINANAVPVLSISLIDDENIDIVSKSTKTKMAGSRAYKINSGKEQVTASSPRRSFTSIRSLKQVMCLCALLV